MKIDTSNKNTVYIFDKAEASALLAFMPAKTTTDRQQWRVLFLSCFTRGVVATDGRAMVSATMHVDPNRGAPDLGEPVASIPRAQLEAAIRTCKRRADMILIRVEHADTSITITGAAGTIDAPDNAPSIQPFPLATVKQIWQRTHQRTRGDTIIEQLHIDIRLLAKLAKITAIERVGSSMRFTFPDEETYLIHAYVCNHEDNIEWYADIMGVRP